MSKILLAVLAFVLLCGCAFAQEEFKKPKQSGCFFVAPGAITINTHSRQTIEIGGGYEGFIHKGFGLGLDVGGMRELSSNSPNWAGIFTLNALYDFQRTANQKLCPFLVGGLTAVSGFDVATGFNVGGGAKYWFAKHAGLRFDFRFHARPGKLNTYQDIQARIGIAFR